MSISATTNSAPIDRLVNSDFPWEAHRDEPLKIAEDVGETDDRALGLGGNPNAQTRFPITIGGLSGTARLENCIIRLQLGVTIIGRCAISFRIQGVRHAWLSI
jgi:hypothetical protein